MPTEEQLSSEGLLPTKPGTYRIFVTWSPYTSRYATCDEVPNDSVTPGKREDSFVTVSSTPITIRIVGTSEAKPNSAE